MIASLKYPDLYTINIFSFFSKFSHVISANLRYGIQLYQLVKLLINFYFTKYQYKTYTVLYIFY